MRQGVFASTKGELLELLTGDDRAVLETALALKAGQTVDLGTAYRQLFAWCQENIKGL